MAISDSKLDAHDYVIITEDELDLGTGCVIFHDNYVAFLPRSAERFPGCAVFVASMGSASVQANRFDCGGEGAWCNTLVEGTTIQVSGNSFVEPVRTGDNPAAILSACTVGHGMNSVLGNQATHCIDVQPAAGPRTVNLGNVSLVPCPW